MARIFGHAGLRLVRGAETLRLARGIWVRRPAPWCPLLRAAGEHPWEAVDSKTSRPYALTPMRSVIVVSVVLFLTACEQRTLLVDPPPSPSQDTADTGVVRKATLVVTVVVAREDSAVAAALGVLSRALPAAQVVVARAGSTGSEQEAVTDVSGQVRFAGLLPGLYSVSISRPIRAEDVARLGDDNADVTAFGGGGLVTVSAPSTEVVMKVVAGRRGSLVFSEFFAAMPRTSAGGWYLLGHYMEVYNNADTAIYLDGKIIARGISWLDDFPELSCAVMAKWRVDPDGIWTGFRYAFPGTGRTYRLAPGATAVIATDAIDHRPFASGLHDLSRADFEFVGSSDVDNPGVPNMINVGPYEWGRILGHGIYLGAGAQVWVLAEAVQEESLLLDFLPVRSPEHRRIPADKLLDVVTLAPTPPRQAASAWRLCAEMVHPRFDRGPAALVDEEALYGIKRRVLRTLPDGRAMLQRTRTTGRDFYAGAATPRVIP